MNPIRNFSDELLYGKGYIILPRIFSEEEVKEANNRIQDCIAKEEQKVTHFQGANKDKMHLQKRVWNLLNKGDIFIKMVQHPKVMEIVGDFLGSEFCLGSIAANCILPSGPGQEPHVDYPYWDMYKKKTFPQNMNASFPLNCQVTVLLNDFTEENGATGVLPYTQKLCRYPNEEDIKRYYKESEQMIGKAGDIAIFYGLTWHSAMPNKTLDQIRSAILIQYLPKFIKPLEDQKRGVKKEIIENASPVLKRLLGFDYPYPKILDSEEVSNAEGRN
ncbi:MAG: ectoine hydroxylase-related dioxygenase (phytanoyl-CoA dioxygenase family) [Nonlabens sp.]|jgi:ectoine hydroxylase-related dioxygenase (phytanoyl-CoA dioxygenase family)